MHIGLNFRAALLAATRYAANRLGGLFLKIIGHWRSKVCSLRESRRRESYGLVNLRAGYILANGWKARSCLRRTSSTKTIFNICNGRPAIRARSSASSAIHVPDHRPREVLRSRTARAPRVPKEIQRLAIIPNQENPSVRTGICP